jgi:phosphate:Na+ symporter
MGELIAGMFDTLRRGIHQRDRNQCDAVIKLDDQVDILHEAILHYLSEIRQQPLTDHQSLEFQALMSANLNLENLADVIETELLVIGKGFIDLGREPSEASLTLLQDLGSKIYQAIEQLTRAIRESDETAAEQVLALKEEVGRIADRFLVHQTQRIGVKEGGHLELVRLELELLDKLRRIYTLAKRVAKEFLPKEIASKA